MWKDKVKSSADSVDTASIEHRFHIEIMSLLTTLHENDFQLQSPRSDVCQSSAFALSNLAQGGDTFCT